MKTKIEKSKGFVARIYNHDGKGFDFFIMEEQGKVFYNLIPIGNSEPDGGYFDPRYIFSMKGF